MERRRKQHEDRDFSCWSTGSRALTSPLVRDISSDNHAVYFSDILLVYYILYSASMFGYGRQEARELGALLLVNTREYYF